MSDQPRDFNPAAAVLGWLWPGLGHISIGERRRGFLMMFGVLFLVVSGLLIGGFDVVDRKEDRLWFLAQAGCGPMIFGADLVNQAYVKNLPPGEREKAVSLGRVNEMGTLFIALAGMMNVVLVLDALQHPISIIDRRSETDS